MVCLGQVVLVVVVLLVVGILGKCMVLLNVWVLIYQLLLLGVIQGQFFDLEIQVVEIEWMCILMEIMLVCYIGKDVGVICKDIDWDKILIVEEVKDYGIIDMVFEYWKFFV